MFKTGFEWLDSRLGGGFPPGHTILVIGPPLSGKRVYLRRFLYIGLASGESAVHVCTSRRYEEELQTFQKMGFDVSRYVGEKRMVFVDLFCREAGLECPEVEGVMRLPSLSDLAALNSVVNEISMKMKVLNTSMRLVVDSLSTLLAYNGIDTVYRMVHLLSGRISASGGVAALSLDSTKPDDEQVLMLSGAVDGVLEFRTLEGKSFVRYSSETTSVSWTYIGEFASPEFSTEHATPIGRGIAPPAYRDQLEL